MATTRAVQWTAAVQALDGYRTRRVVPIGQSVRARTAAEIRAAQRTGTDG